MERNRRKNKLKRSRRRRTRRIAVMFTMLGIILAAVMTFFYMFRVTDVKVAGNTRYSDDMIIQYVQEDLLTTNTMLASWFRKSIEVEDIPFVESLDIEVLDNHAIRIYVNEKQIVGYVVENDHKLFFDKDGYVLEIMPMEESELHKLQEEIEKFEKLRMEEENLQQGTENLEGEEETESSEDDMENGENVSEVDENGESELESGPDDTESTTESTSIDETTEGEMGYEVEEPQVPWILGLEMKNLTLDTRIIVDDSDVFNTIQGIWRMTSKYEIVPDRVFFDEEYNITLVYQEGNILCQLGQDTILEEKITRVAAILPNLTDKTGILHLEDYEINTEGIIFSRESEYTVMSKINRFLQKNS